MSKNKILTDIDIANYSLKRGLTNILSDYAKEKSLEKKSIRILDWGHGRGRTVYLLRESGYNAYGIEIDPVPYNNGLPYFVGKGHKPEEFLFLVSEGCITQFPDNYFDIVISEQVLEHVRDLDACMAEISRITKTGGIHSHQFPAKWHFTEQHLFMSMIHWLPKNYLQFLLIHLNVMLKNYPEWPSIPKSLKAKQKAKYYYNYSVEKTFYRSTKQLKSIFLKNKLSIECCNTSYIKKGRRLTVNRYFPAQINMQLRKLKSPAG